MQAVGYLVRAQLLAAGHELPASLTYATTEQSARGSPRDYRAKLRSLVHSSTEVATLRLERQHRAFVLAAGNDGDGKSSATTQITQLSICENDIGAQGVRELMILFHPSIGEAIWGSEISCMDRCDPPLFVITSSSRAFTCIHRCHDCFIAIWTWDLLSRVAS